MTLRYDRHSMRTPSVRPIRGFWFRRPCIVGRVHFVAASSQPYYSVWFLAMICLGGWTLGVNCCEDPENRARPSRPETSRSTVSTIGPGPIDLFVLRLTGDKRPKSVCANRISRDEVSAPPDMKKSFRLLAQGQLDITKTRFGEIDSGAGLVDESTPTWLRTHVHFAGPA